MADDQSNQASEAKTWRDVGLAILIAVAFLLICSSVGYTIIKQPQENSFTEKNSFTELQVEVDKNGTTRIPYVTDGLTQKDITTLHFVVDRHGNHPQAYTAIVQVRDSSGSLLYEQEYSERVSPTEMWRQQLNITPRPGSPQLFIRLHNESIPQGQPEHVIEEVPLYSASNETTATTSSRT